MTDNGIQLQVPSADMDYLIPYDLIYGEMLKEIKGYSVYADESMNLRKVRLTPNMKKILKYKFFVLGGIECPSSFDFSELKAELRKMGMPESEIKYKFFSYNNSDFSMALKSKRLNTLFSYLLKNKIYIHLNVLNYWYWAVSDIVDSLGGDDCFDININRQRKMAMYEGLMQYYDETYNIFCKSNFPSISHGKEKDFLIEILIILKKTLSINYKEGDELYLPLFELVQYIDSVINKISELLLIQDEQPFEIVSSLANLYIESAFVFKSNGLIIDNEQSIIGDINSISSNLLSSLNCTFADSKDYFEIQLSDVICGFAARMFEFFVDEKNTLYFFDTLKTNSIELRNLSLFRKLLLKSINLYQLNYIKIMSAHHDISIQRVLALIDALSMTTI